MLIPMKELNSKHPDINGVKTSIYYLDDSVLAKRFKHLTDNEKRQLIKKYENSQNMHNLKHVSLPIDILKTEKGFCGYIENILPGTKNAELISYADYYNENKYTITLEDITSYILKACEIVEQCHNNNLINPDLASEGNVMFHKTTHEVYFTDYQGMQINNIPSGSISSFITPDPIINSKKYYNNQLYSKNIDLYTLAIRYFYYATKINIPRAMSNGFDINILIEQAGISNSQFANCLKALYDLNTDNMDIREPIIELNKNYTLSTFKMGESKVFLKK